MRRSVRFKQGSRLPTIVTIAALAAFVVAMFFVLRTREGFDVSRDEVAWANLPRDASEINYYVGNLLDGYTSLAFNTSEASFRQWVDTTGRPADTPLEEAGRHAFMIQLHVRDSDGSAAVATMDIEDGLSCTWRKGGAYVRVAYDRGRGRAYYFRSEH